MNEKRRSISRTRWFMPAWALFLGALVFGAFAIGGSVGQGAASFAVYAAVAALFIFGRRSETLQGIGGPQRDERWSHIDLVATAVTGLAMIAAVIAGFLYEAATGGNGSPYAQIGAIGGVAYVIAVAIGRRRG